MSSGHTSSVSDWPGHLSGPCPLSLHQLPSSAQPAGDRYSEAENNTDQPHFEKDRSTIALVLHFQSGPVSVAIVSTHQKVSISRGKHWWHDWNEPHLKEDAD